MMTRHLERRRRRQRSVIAAWLSLLLLAIAAVPVGTMVPSAQAAGLILEVSPETASARTGTPATLTASVTDTSGDGVSGTHVDFEVTSGPGDGSVGTVGDTPATPDLSCTTSGGGAGVPATCTVTYTETDNTAGTDAIRAWIDLDGSNASVEADMAEGRDESSGGASTCATGTTGAGNVAEPDITDCVSQTWTDRVASYIDVSSETDTYGPGATVTVQASAYDQDRNLMTGAGTSTHVPSSSRRRAPTIPVARVAARTWHATRGRPAPATSRTWRR